MTLIIIMRRKRRGRGRRRRDPVTHFDKCRETIGCCDRGLISVDVADRVRSLNRGVQRRSHRAAILRGRCEGRDGSRRLHHRGPRSVPEPHWPQSCDPRWHGYSKGRETDIPSLRQEGRIQRGKGEGSPALLYQNCK